MKTKNPMSKEDQMLKVLASQISLPQEINNQDKAIESLIFLWNKKAERPKSDLERKHLQWNNLIYISIEFHLKSYLFKEEFLWDRTRRDPSIIKQFAIELIQNKIIGNNNRLKEGIGSFTFEDLELIAGYVCKQIIHEIKFYEMFKPYQMFTNGLFDSVKQIEGQHLINIHLDIENKYKDDFKWNIINNYNIPEDFAEELVIENNLDQSFSNKIALSIRKQIKEYVFCTFEAFALNNSTKLHSLPLPSLSKAKSDFRKKKNCQTKLDSFLIKESQMKNNQISLDNFVREERNIKLNSFLGKKKYRVDDSLPSFLKNNNEQRKLNTNTKKDNQDNVNNRDKKVNEYIIGINHKIIIINKAILNYSFPSLKNNIPLKNDNNNPDNDDIKSKSSQSHSTSTNIKDSKPRYYMTRRRSTMISSNKDLKEL